jgi:hypothetical protein
MPKPKITEVGQVLISAGEGQETKASKRLVTVVKPYRDIPDFYGRVLDVAVKGPAGFGIGMAQSDVSGSVEVEAAVDDPESGSEDTVASRTNGRKRKGKGK